MASSTAAVRATSDRQNQQPQRFRLSGRQGPVTVLTISAATMVHLTNALEDGQVLPSFRDENFNDTISRAIKRLQEQGLFPSDPEIKPLLTQAVQLRSQGIELRVSLSESVKLAGQPPFGTTTFDIDGILYQFRIFSALWNAGIVYGLGVITNTLYSDAEAQIFTSQPGVEPTHVVWLNRHWDWNEEADFVEKWTPFVHKDSDQAAGIATAEEEASSQDAENDASMAAGDPNATAAGDIAGLTAQTTANTNTSNTAHRHHESAFDCQGLTGQQMLDPNSNFPSDSLFGGRALYIACDIPNGKVLPLLNLKRQAEGLPELRDRKTWHHRLISAKRHIFGEDHYAQASADLKNAQKSAAAKTAYRNVLMDPTTYTKNPRESCTVQEWKSKKKDTTSSAPSARATATAAPIASSIQASVDAEQDRADSPREALDAEPDSAPEPISFLDHFIASMAEDPPSLQGEARGEENLEMADGAFDPDAFDPDSEVWRELFPDYNWELDYNCDI